MTNNNDRATFRDVLRIRHEGTFRKHNNVLESPEIVIERVYMCLYCNRILDVCLKDPCYKKIIDGTFREVPKALKEKEPE